MTVQIGDPKLNPFANCVLLSLRTGKLGVTKKVKREKAREEIEVECDQTLLRVNKTLIESPEFDAITSHRGKLSAYLRKMQIPGAETLFRSGMYPIPLGRLEEVDSYVNSAINQDNDLVDTFCKVYTVRKEETKARLKNLADDDDYPPASQIRRYFKISFDWTSYGPPENINGALSQREWEKFQQNCAVAAEEVKLALRELLAELLSHLVERLQPSKDGKKKKIYESTIKDIKEFLKGFKDVNVTNDTELEVIVRKCERIMEGKDPELLRKNDRVREATASTLEQVKRSLEGMIGEMPSRKIQLDDE